MNELLTKLPNQYGTPVGMVLHEGHPLIVTADGYLLRITPQGLGKPAILHTIVFELGERQLP